MICAQEEIALYQLAGLAGPQKLDVRSGGVDQWSWHALSVRPNRRGVIATNSEQGKSGSNWQAMVLALFCDYAGIGGCINGHITCGDCFCEVASLDIAWRRPMVAHQKQH